MIAVLVAGVIPALLCGVGALGVCLTYAEYRGAKKRARIARGKRLSRVLKELEPGLNALFGAYYDDEYDIDYERSFR